jgi:hypothetical protein
MWRAACFLAIREPYHAPLYTCNARGCHAPPSFAFAPSVLQESGVTLDFHAATHAATEGEGEGCAGRQNQTTTLQESQPPTASESSTAAASHRGRLAGGVFLSVLPEGPLAGRHGV